MIHPLFLDDKLRTFLRECKLIFGPQCGLDLESDSEIWIETSCRFVNTSDLDKLRPLIGEIRAITACNGNVSILVVLPPNDNPKTIIK